MKIIAFTGMPFAGKTEAVKVTKEAEIPMIRMGDMVWNEVNKRGLKLNDNNVGTIANQMREKHGRGIWAIKTINKIKTMGNIDSIVIDGIRNVEEIEVFKSELGDNFVVIAVETSEETRRKRALERRRKDDSKDVKKLKERDQRELGWGLGSVIASADIVILNNGSIDDFRKKIKEILKRL
jgi:dephospho-CoA kinase